MHKDTEGGRKIRRSKAKLCKDKTVSTVLTRTLDRASRSRL